MNNDINNNFHNVNEHGGEENNDDVRFPIIVLLVGSIPPLYCGYIVSLLKNNGPISILIKPESLDTKGR